MTLDQMRSRLAQDGLSYSTYRSQIRKEMTISEVRNNEVRRRVTILPQEVDARAAGWQPKRCQHRAEPEPHSDPITGKPNVRAGKRG